MPVVAPRWQSLACDDTASASLAAALDIAPVVARLLCQRGFTDPERAFRFLNPSLNDGTIISYITNAGVMRALFAFDAAGRIKEANCNPSR